MMDCRLSHLERSLDALIASNEPLVLLVDHSYGLAGFADDPGIYYFIPLIAKTFGISIMASVHFFFGSLLALGAILSILSFFFLFKKWSARCFSIVGILGLTAIAYHYFDVYILSFFVCLSIVPPFLLIRRDYFRIILLIFSGILIGYSNMIRAHSGTGVLLFLLISILFGKDFSIRSKVTSILTLALSICLPYAHFQKLENRRDRFLVQMNADYQRNVAHHPFWHPFYLGFGYLDNPYGIEWSDSVGLAAARSVNPLVSSCSEEYEQILKTKCIFLFKTDPLFVLKTLFAKALSLLLKVLLFVNVGLIFAFLVKPSVQLVYCIRPETWDFERAKTARTGQSLIPFSIAILFYALPGLIAIPDSRYVLGMLCMAALFGIYITCTWLEGASLGVVQQ